MRRKRGLILAAVLVLPYLFSRIHAFAVPPVSAGVTAEIVPEVSAIEPGESFLIGLLLRAEPGWHTYWKNPGDAGLPTRVTAELPAGFVAGELVWPTPGEFRQPGDIVGFGYEGDAMLVLPIETPKTTKRGTTVEIPVTVRWLGCSATVCVPGSKTETIAVSIGERAETQGAASVRRAFARAPIGPERAEFREHVNAKISGTGLPVSIELKLVGAPDGRSFSWFAYAPPGTMFRADTGTKAGEVSVLRGKFVLAEERKFPGAAVAEIVMREESGHSFRVPIEIRTMNEKGERDDT